jgi:3-oxoacyl-[acyl-carrier-protein] synthase II
MGTAAEHNAAQRRVVITGIGLLTPVGIGKDRVWEALLAGQSGIAPITQFNASEIPWKIAGEVKDFDPSQWIGKKEARHMDRFSHLGLVASFLAIEDARLDLTKENPERVGVSVSTATGGYCFTGEQMHLFMTRGLTAINPYAAVSVYTGSATSQISRYLGVKGPSMTLSTGCDAGADAIEAALEMIRGRTAEIVITGGTEATISPFILASFGVVGALSERNLEPERASRPYDKYRDGFVMAEGAGILILEELQHALNRRATIYAEILAAATTCDAYGLTSPEPSGAQGARAITETLWRAGVAPEEVDYINSHGTSTPKGDVAETRVLKRAFGDLIYQIPCSSIKSMTGHMQGASAAVEVAVSALSIRDNVIPPTINYEYPDPDCDLDYVPNKARHRRCDVVLSNSFSFGGRNTAVLLRRYPLNGQVP